MAKVHENLVRAVVNVIDILNAHDVELLEDETAVFYSEYGRAEKFTLTYRSDDHAPRGFCYEVGV